MIEKISAHNLRDPEDEVPVVNFLRPSHHSHAANVTTETLRRQAPAKPAGFAGIVRLDHEWLVRRLCDAHGSQ